MKKNKFLKFLRYIVGISLTVFLLKKFFGIDVDFSNFELNILLLLFGIIFQIFAFFLVTYRSFYLLKCYIKKFSEALKMYFIGWFFSNILPSNVGGDGYMILYVKSKSKSLSTSIALITFQRILGLLVLILYILFYLIFTPVWISRITLNINLSLIKIIMLITGSILIPGILFFAGKIKKFLSKLFIEIEKIGIKNSLVLILLTFLYQLIRLAGFFFLIKSFGISVDIPALFFIMCLVSIGSMIPISIGALGVQESLFIVGLTLIDVSLPISIIIAYINRFIFLVLAIIGGILFALSRNTEFSFIRNENK